MAEDFLEALSAARERKLAATLARERIERRDETARVLVRELDKAPLDAHVHSLAKAFGVPKAFLRSVLALELARCRVREREARAAATGGVK